MAACDLGKCQTPGTPFSFDAQFVMRNQAEKGAPGASSVGRPQANVRTSADQVEDEVELSACRIVVCELH
jgi:hypothetical protein